MDDIVSVLLEILKSPTVRRSHPYAWKGRGLLAPHLIKVDISELIEVLPDEEQK